MMALTQDQAAEKLGKSRRTIQAYETGTPPAKVDYGTRIVMQIIAHGKTPPEPWPE
jgi:DNA-binding XRE family transcriptional regulator